MSKPAVRPLLISFLLLAPPGFVVGFAPTPLTQWTPPQLVALATGPGSNSFGLEGVTLGGSGSNNLTRIDPPAGPFNTIGAGHPSGIHNFVSALDEGRGRFFYRSHGNLTVLDARTGAYIESFPVPANLIALDYDPGHDRLVALATGAGSGSFSERGIYLAGSGENQLLHIDPATGVVTSIAGGLPGGILNFAAAIDDGGNRYFYLNATSLVTADANTGALLAAVPFNLTLVSLEFDVLNDRLLGLRWWPGSGGFVLDGVKLNGGPIDLAVVDAGTGDLDFIATGLPNGIQNFAAAYDHQNGRYHYQTGGNLVSVDATPGGSWTSVAAPINIVALQNHRAFGPPPGCEDTGPWNCAIEVSLASQWIQVHQFSKSSSVTIEVKSSNGDPIFGPQTFQTDEVGHLMINPDLGGLRMKPGDLVSARDEASGREKNLTLAFVSIDGVDPGLDRVWGKAEPNARVLVGPPDPRLEVFANGNGDWTADFASIGFNVEPELSFIANVFDGEGDSTADEEFPPRCAVGPCPDFAIEDLRVETIPRLFTDWGNVHDGMRRVVTIRLANHGDEWGTAKVNVVAQTASDGVERFVAGFDHTLKAHETQELKFEWNAIGQVGDVEIVAHAHLEDDPTPENNEARTWHYSLVGGTGRGYAVAPETCAEAPANEAGITTWACAGTRWFGNTLILGADADVNGTYQGAWVVYDPFRDEGAVVACGSVSRLVAETDCIVAS